MTPPGTKVPPLGVEASQVLSNFVGREPPPLVLIVVNSEPLYY